MHTYQLTIANKLTNAQFTERIVAATAEDALTMGRVNFCKTKRPIILPNGREGWEVVEEISHIQVITGVHVPGVRPGPF
jgi:hypothetical protein